MTPEGSTISLLRNHTHAIHEALHHHPVLALLPTPEVTEPYYQNALHAFTSIYHVAERTLPPDTPHSAPVLRWLEMDHYLHHLPPSKVIDSSGFNLDWNSSARQLGYLYVKQGSNMGGLVISKMLETTLSLKPGIENHFFYGYGKKSKARWDALSDTLEKLNDDEKKEAADAALEMFRWVAHCCDQYKDPT